MRLFKHLTAFLILAMCWLTVAHANTSNDTGPKEAVEMAVNRVIEVLRKEGDVIRDDPDKIYGLVNEYILPHFDFDRMSYFVLGKAWKEASEQQKENFQHEFKQLLITTYSTALSEYSTDEEILYKSVMISPKNENIAIVPTEIKQAGAGPVSVIYRMYRSEGVWRIYDVSIEGVSLVKNYRANFAGQVRSNGLDGLIITLAGHNQPEENSAVTLQKVSQ